MKRLSAVLFGLLLVSLSHGQQRWERTYGGAEFDNGYSVRQTSDGGYIVAGRTNSFGHGYQVYLVKTNASGDTLWNRSYGGTEDQGFSVQQTTDLGYIVVGYSGWGMGTQVHLIKTDASGDALWSYTYGATEEGFSVQQTTDGGYIVGGMAYDSTGAHVLLKKFNASGDTLWTRHYGGTGYDGGSSVQQTTDGGYIITGSSAYQTLLVKTNASGDSLWGKVYGLSGGNSVQQTTDGGYIVAGTTGPQAFLLKTDASGDTLWTRTYGGATTEKGNSVQQTSDGGYIVGGSSDSYGDSSQVLLVKTNASGDTLWTRTYGGPRVEGGASVQQTSDLGYIIAGYTYSYGAGNEDVYLIKTDANGNVGVEKTEGRGQRLEVRITAKPNPFTSFATVPGHSTDRFALYDISGRRVGVYRGDRIGEGLRAGVYFIRSLDSKDKPLRIVKVR